VTRDELEAVVDAVLYDAAPLKPHQHQRDTIMLAADAYAEHRQVLEDAQRKGTTT
jgi:hypothetical protein